ncbi:amidohydrolase family protein [bacterium]|nr:amidohydrolase family protein [bacterium]
MKKALYNVNKLIADTTNNIEGIHLEGPFINPDKLGAQPALTHLPSNEFIENILGLAHIKIITLAPEIEGMKEFIKFLINKNIQVQFGHTLANFKTSNEYLTQYPIGFTHLYNAMSGHASRESGVLSSALLNGKFAEIICDNNHVSEQAIKIAYKCIPGLYSVSDAIAATGLSDGLYNFAGVDIEKKNNKVCLKGTNTLAGSVITMHETFKNLINMNFSFEDAVKMTSYNASKYLKLENVGILKEENISNFVVLDKNLNLLRVFLNGKVVSD